MARLVWFVTGCSTGLGRQLIKAILQRGDKAIATARDVDSLKELKEAGAETIQLDVTAGQKVLDDKASEAIAKYGHIDVVVNNAGTIQFGTVEDLNYEKMLAVFNVNFFAPLNISRAFIPHFRSRNAGTIVFVGSVAGWQAFAGNSAYAGSKAALQRALEALSSEVGPAGIKVLDVWPGGFETKFAHADKHAFPRTEHFAWLYDIVAKIFAANNWCGSVENFANALVDLVKSQGVAEGRALVPQMPTAEPQLLEKWQNLALEEIPLGLPLGSDSLRLIRGKVEGVLRMLNQWQSVITSTDRTI